MTDLAQSLIEQQEGLRLTAYKDSLGLWTVGYGHELDNSRDWSGYSISQFQAQMLLEADIAIAKRVASMFPHFAELNEVRQAALISMAFQLGRKPLLWPEFMDQLQAKNYDEAAIAGLDSVWARDETPDRARLEMTMLQTGELA